MRGSCLCGAVRWETEAAPIRTVACHCRQCRRQTGHFLASMQVPTAALRVAGGPRWFHASEEVRRGFCPACGSVLFWDEEAGRTTYVALGSVDGPTGLRIERHIFVEEKGDYYDIPAGEPAQEGDG